MPVQRYVTPAEFEMWQKEGEAAGFVYVASGPLVRSSYRAGEFFMEALLDGRMGAEKAKLASLAALAGAGREATVGRSR